MSTTADLQEAPAATWDFSVIRSAAITQSEFADLVGVSRVTVNLWCRAKMAPHRYIKAKIAAVLGHMQSAVEIGDLPLADSLPPEQRLGALADTIKRAVLRAKVGAPTAT